MKHIKVFVIVAVVLCAFGSLAFGQSAAPAFETTKAFNKLDAPLQQAWLDAKKSGDMSRRLDCFVRVQPPFDRGDQSFLISAGYNVRAVGGPVATGCTTAGDLPDVANLDFVVSIKMAN